MLIESEKQVQTAHGNISITIYGDRHKIPILTLHDVGSNAEETFARFFQSPIGDEIGTEFCIYNINAPGQQKNVKEFPFWYHYPTMDNFVHIIEEIVDFFNLKSFVGFGVGAGANIMLRYALKHQDNVDALILINCVINSAGWHEWIYQKSNILLLRHFGMSEATIDYFNWWHFGSPHHKRNPHEVTRYQEYLRKEAHPKSLAAFLESYMNRTPIEIITKHENENHAFRIPVLHMVGSHSAFMHEAIRINKLLEQQNTIELMEFTDCGGNFLIEKANKVFEAILLFLQGAGFFAWLNVHDVVKRVQEEENEMILRNEETKDSASNDKPLEKEDVFAD